VTGGARGAERQAEDGAEMILELARDGAFDGPVAGIVDARGHFIGEKLALVLEEFDGEDADVFEGFEDTVGGAFRGALDLRIEARGGSEREAKDAAAMVVFDERVDGGFAGAGADGEDGEFAGEGDEALENEGDGGKFGLSFDGIFCGAKNPLAFAIVAHAGCFEDGREAE